MTNIIRPGILVSLKTALSGGVLYTVRPVEDEHVLDTGEAIARWETEKKITDKAEHEKATTARSKASQLVRAVCVHTAFGLLCPESKERELDEAIGEARKLCDEFNANATVCKIGLYVLKGRIAQTDQEAASAVASEVRDLIEEMDRGIKLADPKIIRDAAMKAKQVSAVLDEAKQAQVGVAVESARKAAREITARVVKAGEKADKVIASLKQEAAAVGMVRAMFLDIETPSLAKTDGANALPATDVRRMGSIELDAGE